MDEFFTKSVNLFYFGIFILKYFKRAGFSYQTNSTKKKQVSGRLNEASGRAVGASGGQASKLARAPALLSGAEGAE